MGFEQDKVNAIAEKGACPFCKETAWKPETITMSSIKAVFECSSCGLLWKAKNEEMALWGKMKGRIEAPKGPPPAGYTIDPDLVARSTHIVTGADNNT